MAAIDAYMKDSALLLPLLYALGRIAIIFLLSAALLSIFRQKVYWLADLIPVLLLYFGLPMLESVFVGTWFGGSYEKYQYVLFPLIIGAALWGTIHFLYPRARKACASKTIQIAHQIFQALICLSAIMVSMINGFAMWHGMFEDDSMRAAMLIYSISIFVWKILIGVTGAVVLFSWLRKIRLHVHIEVNR